MEFSVGVVQSFLAAFSFRNYFVIIRAIVEPGLWNKITVFLVSFCCSLTVVYWHYYGTLLGHYASYVV